ncbi:MAG: ABC transporter ATP-binding protein [Actinomycetes bacterium]
MSATEMPAGGMPRADRADRPDEPLVEVRDLRVVVGGRQISGLSELVMHRGECVALVGESGSGKTTALMAMLGLLGPMGATITGSARVCGVDVLTAKPAQLRGIRGVRIALVMQSPQGSLNPTMRLGNLLRRTLMLHGVSRSEVPRRARAALAGVQLPEAILNRYPHEVSGGQAQRFGIALALALGAEVIAADEPTSALDVTVQAEIMGLLHRFRVERGLALLLVSHDLALVSTVADRVVVMRNGDVVESGPTRELFTDPSEGYTRELLAAVPRWESMS